MELLGLTAREAVTVVNGMDTETGLDRARRSERDQGPARRPVLVAAERRRKRL